MILKINKISVFILAIVIATGLTTTINFNSAVFAQNGKLIANLSGQEEVPPVNSTATGVAEFTPSNDTVGYIVSADNIQNVTAGHIHSGTQGENGPIIVTLFKFDTAESNASLDNSTITADKLEGDMKGKQISDLVDAMNSGNTYVNIHTSQNPNGEVRGQIAP
ncbi:MAG: CHRD domain-containing protein [Nitrosopumilus sp.]|nr:CHRD domain-containing protein [Nitrosopumilus sp.]